MSEDILMRDRTLAGDDVSKCERAAAVMDEETFRAFYDRTARPLWVYLARLSGDPHLADDLLQETYYRFCRAGAAYESDSHRRNSLYLIATNAARDVIRRRRRAPLVPLPDDEDLAAIAAEDRGASNAEKRTDLSRVMQELSPEQRAMLWLAYGNGSSHEEIAATIGVKAGSVKPLLFRARQKLAALLRPEVKR